jgi:carbon monoxide dehydrogenase subunit G
VDGSKPGSSSNTATWTAPVRDGKAFEEEWSVEVTTATVDVNRGPDEVFAYVTDPTRFAEWQDGVVSAHMESGELPRVGDKCFMTRRIGFAQRVVASEVTHVDPPRSWGVRGIDGPIRATVDVIVEDLGPGQRSRVSIDIGFEGHGIGKLIVPLVIRPQAAKEMPANLKRLKQRLEGSESSIR